MSLFLILLAAGEGKRLESNTPKPFHKINNKTLLEHSIKVFQNFRNIKKTIVVYNKKHKKHLNKIKLKNVIKIKGGKNRQESTLKALNRIKNMNCTKVMIHDSARPNISKSIIKKIILNLKKNHAVIPSIKINDATKRVKNNIIFKNIDRSSLRFSQTPQGFTFKKIYEKHRKNMNKSVNDDAALFVNDKEKVLNIS